MSSEFPEGTPGRGSGPAEGPSGGDASTAGSGGARAQASEAFGDSANASGERANRGGDSAREDGTSGQDLARAALRAARERSGRSGRPQAGRKKAPSRRRRGWSGAGDDEQRDPQAFGNLASRLASDRGWSDRLAGGHLFGRWTELVGEEIAAHSKPVELREGVLTLQAESTAWATQLRLLQRQIVQRISDGLGQRLVRSIRVQGPAAPSWRYGPRHVQGRGPRDTYG
ncbi:putative nucleic acid-binding Zn ribbon protein [Actinopolyspora biskrensis]|uniref:UPF0232 protein FHR84_004151 n=1 Tax=Actinopolyspora biskrensis TaxID=1470178 RepID=A0A852ZFL3_9ACTN|nr:DciA family protein [Actinopolyspora biskrensis]NYH80783.1 putative nucleic acid-binding Zn ribbon protein [Actinopolyspora biskrensis]